VCLQGEMTVYLNMKMKTLATTSLVNVACFWWFPLQYLQIYSLNYLDVINFLFIFCYWSRAFNINELMLVSIRHVTNSISSITISVIFRRYLAGIPAMYHKEASRHGWTKALRCACSIAAIFKSGFCSSSENALILHKRNIQNRIWKNKSI